MYAKSVSMPRVNSWRNRQRARMPVGPLRGHRIYNIQSAKILLDALEYPACLMLNRIERTAIEHQLQVADWSDVDNSDDEHQSDLVDFVNRCKAAVRKLEAVN